MEGGEGQGGLVSVAKDEAEGWGAHYLMVRKTRVVCVSHKCLRCLLDERIQNIFLSKKKKGEKEGGGG